MNIHGNAHVGIGGEFKAILYNEDGSIAVETEWAHNHIVNNGLILYGANNWFQKCTIGSDGTAPVDGNSTIGSLLGTHVGTSSNPLSQADYPRPPVTPNYERYSVKKWRFVAGNGTGTVREFTIGAGDNGTNIFCRHALPAPIVKAANQVLDIFYRFYVYPDLTPTTGSVLIDGVNYDWECSFYNVQIYNSSLFAAAGFNSGTLFFDVWDGAKAAPTDTSPTGNKADTGVIAFVGSGSGYEDWRWDIDLDDCNTATDKITVAGVVLNTIHKVQCTFAATDGPDIGGGIPKDSTKIMSVTLRTSWGRYP